jgi:potassium/hydrogen antiporter
LRRPSRIFTSRGWHGRDGDPSRPRELLGVPVSHRLAVRRDAPGALVRLADRRYALTGRMLAVGPPRALDRYIRRRSVRGGAETGTPRARRLLRTSSRRPAGKHAP